MNFWNIARPEESPVLKKTLSIMRLTTLFSIACSLQISASVYSQETKLSLDVNNQTIKEVLFQDRETVWLPFYLREREG